jgi:hypothetical protein
MKKLLVSFVILISSALSFALNVEVQVKECAGVGSNGFPITAVVPLPKGAFQNTNTFRVTDGSGTTVPAQFSVMNRRLAQDQSIANVLVRFQPTVSAFSGAGTGIATYYLKDDGSGNATGTGLTVTEDGTQITVNTGVLRFTVKKSGFNIFDKVWLNDQLIVEADATSGGELVNWKDQIQKDIDRNDVLVEVEESGPMEAIIKVEAVTKYVGPSNHTHGWAVRIYAYAGKSFVKVDYQLQNSSKDKKFTWPLYFHSMNLNFNLKLTGTPTVRVGLDNGTMHSVSRGNGVLLAQMKDSLFNVYSSLDTNGTVLSSGGRPVGVLNVDDGVFGVSAVTRFFYQTWPNGIQVNSSNKLQLQLWPEWSCQVTTAAKNPVFNSTGLYWLQDMQHSYKEVYLDFHTSGKSSAEVLNFAKTVDYHPVACCKTEWYGTARASLDLEGAIGSSSKISTTDQRLPVVKSSVNLGWNWFAVIDRRVSTANVGGDPMGQGHFFVTENPADWYNAECHAWGEINIRPNSMAQYKFDRDWPTLKLGVNVCGSDGLGMDTEDFGYHENWRQQDCGSTVYDSARIEGTTTNAGGSGLLLGRCDVRQPPHGWFYHVADAYFMSGNLWIKDWYKFIAEYRKVFIGQNKAYGSVRGDGHWAAQALTAGNIVGDSSVIGLVSRAWVNILKPKYRQNTGDRNHMCCGAAPKNQVYEEGYKYRQVVNTMSIIKDYDMQTYATLFNWLAGTIHFNMKYANWSSTWAPQVSSFYLSGYTFADAQAWFYHNTGRKPVFDFIMNPEWAKTGWGLFALQSYNTDKWFGLWGLRYAQYIRDLPRLDTVPPQRIANLSMTRNGTSCQLQWTAPTDAKKYHVVWYNKPIVDSFTMNDFDYRYCQWFSANAVGTNMVARPGQAEQLSFTVPDTGIIIAAVFSFDSANNMSLISNNAISDNIPASAPPNLQASNSDGHSIQLSWDASTDGESGIYWYVVYRNGVALTTLIKRTFSETDLLENTLYRYEVAAVNGSLVEGPKSMVELRLPVDAVAPFVVSTSAYSTTKPYQIVIKFNEKLNESSAEVFTNYAINGGVSVQNTELFSDGRSVLLTVDSLTKGAQYQLTVNGVRDASVAGNVIATNTVSTFSFTDPYIYKVTKPAATSISPTSAYYNWTIMTPGVSCFTDNMVAMDIIPDEFIGLPLLQTMNANEAYCRQSGNDTAYVFNFNKETKVYVAYDNEQTAANRMPAWLKDPSWVDTQKDINNWSVFVKTFPAGTVSLLGNNGIVANSMYFVFIEPTDGSAYMFSQNLALLKEVNASASQEYRTSGKKYLVDGEKGIGSSTYGWSSSYVPQNSTHWVEVDLGADMAFTQIVLYTPTDTMTVEGKCVRFPIDFFISARTSSGVDTTLFSFTDYPAPDYNTPVIFNFPAVIARFVRITGTKHSLGYNTQFPYNRYFDLKEMEIYNKSAVIAPPVSIEGDLVGSFIEGINAYPNPFNPSVTVVFNSRDELSSAALVLKVYNIAGREVARINPVRSFSSAGGKTYLYHWSASKMPSGMYLFNMDESRKNWKRKALLLK